MDKLEIYNQLKEEIIDLKIEPGALISENEISRRFQGGPEPRFATYSCGCATTACWKSCRSGERRYR